MVVVPEPPEPPLLFFFFGALELDGCDGAGLLCTGGEYAGVVVTVGGVVEVTLGVTDTAGAGVYDGLGW
jgi:hypothetical protein